MNEQQDYAISQYDSCCTLLGLDPKHNASGPTLWDCVRELTTLRDTLRQDLATAQQKSDTALLDAVKQGIASAPDRTLTQEVLGAMRLPVPASKFSSFARAFPKDSRCTQRGEWLLIIQP